MIALMGLDAETGVFMLLFLDLAYGERRRAGRMRTGADLMKRVAVLYFIWKWRFELRRM